MNELELLTSFRDEVPVPPSSPVERSVMTAIRAGKGGRARTARSWGLAATRWPRPVLAGTLAAAVGATAYGVVALTGSQGFPAASQTIAWSGQPTAAWPAGPSYGRASTEDQLIAYVTRAAADALSRPPKPNEWVAVKTEYSDNFKSSHGSFTYGPPGTLKISLAWFRYGTRCAEASVPDVPASTPPTEIVSEKLRIDEGASTGLPGCDPRVQLTGWKSVSYSYLSSLPTDPAALESVLLAANPPGGAYSTREEAIFVSIRNLLTAGPSEGIAVPPKLRASLYRVLQQLPGVHFESAADLAGRTGLGFWMVQEGYLKEEIVIDPDTYTPMGSKDVAITDHTAAGTDGTAYIHKGDVTDWRALLGTAVVQHPGQLP